jgi:hypothetical protein
VHDQVGFRDHLNVAIGFDLDDLVDRVENDLVLLRLVDDGDLFGAFLVVEDDPVAGTRLDELGVILVLLAFGCEETTDLANGASMPRSLRRCTGRARYARRLRRPWTASRHVADSQ